MQQNITTSYTANKTYQYAATFACFWLFVAWDSFIIWNPYEYFIRFLAFLGIGIFSISIIKPQLKVRRSVAITFLTTLILTVWYMFRMDINILGKFARIMTFAPMMLLLLWPSEVLYLFYQKFRRIIIIVCIGATITSLLTMIGLISYIPHFSLQAREALHQQMGIVYYVYGFIVTIHSIVPSAALRICGILQEPGHFAILLGFLYLTDRNLEIKPSYWLIVSGFLTFSPNFILIILFTELTRLSRNHINVKNVFLLLLFIGVFSIGYRLLDDDIKEQISFLVYERNALETIDTYESGGSFLDIMDQRTNSTGKSQFSNMQHKDLIFGMGVVDQEVILSDFRGMILFSGIIGFTLSILVAFSTTLKTNFRLKTTLLLTLGLIYIHRAWMFYGTYIYWMSYMAGRVVEYHRIKYDQR